jgi:hypothetical protein
MNYSSNISSLERDNKKEDPSSQDRNSPFADFTLTYDQYFMLQHLLPKKYVLLEAKPTPGKRGPITHLIKNLITTE